MHQEAEPIAQLAAVLLQAQGLAQSLGQEEEQVDVAAEVAQAEG